MTTYTAEDCMGSYIQRGQFVWKAVETTADINPRDIIPVNAESYDARCKINEISVKVVSANAQSMHHKHRYLEEQMLEQGYQIGCYQESKDRESFVESQHLLRFCPDSDRHWGVEDLGGQKTEARQSGSCCAKG